MIKLEDLNNLGLEDVSQWPQPLKWAVLGVVFVVVVAFGYTLDTRSQIKQRAIAIRQEKEFKAQFKVSYQNLLQMRKLREHVSSAENVLGEALAQLPREVNIQEFLDDVSKLGAQSQVEFRLLKPLAPNVQQFYAAIPIQIEVSGNYHQLAHFISGIANSDHPVAFGNFSVNRSEHPQKDKSARAVKANQDNPMLELNAIVELFHYENESSQSPNSVKG